MNKYLTNLVESERFRNSGLWLGVLIFIRTQPCYLWMFEAFLRPVCTILIMIVCVRNISHEKWTGLIFGSIAFAYIWATVFVDHTSIITVLNFLAFAFIPILRKEVVFETYNVFYKIVVFFLAVSLVNYLLYTLGLTFGGIKIAPLNTIKSITYTMYPFLVVPSSLTLRFHSIFDEPGVVGTICAMILVAEKMDFKKRQNIVFLIAGILSMSMFFYVGLGASVVLFVNNNKYRLAYILLLFAFVILTYNNTTMYDTIWSRFVYDESKGTFAGDNRSGGLVGDYFDSIVGTSVFFKGHGSEFVEQFQGEASLKLMTIKYGFIFVFFNVVGYFILSFREIKSKKDWFFFILFFLCTIYQRPGFINTSSIFLFTMVIYLYAYNIEKKYCNESRS